MPSVSSLVVWHPGTSMSTADVCENLCAGLRAQGVHVDEYPMDTQIVLHGKMLNWLWQEHGQAATRYTSTDVMYKAGKELLVDACRARRLHGTEWVLVVSGMYQHPDLFVYLRDAGFKLAVLLTESPYDLEHEREAIDRRRVTGAREPVANVVFTNERTCVEAFRAVQPRSYYLPHAWMPRPKTAATEAQTREVPSYDVVFVGTYFDERVYHLAAVDWTDVQVGLYGTTHEIRDMAAATGPPRYLPEFARRACEARPTVTPLQRAARALERHIRGGYVPNRVTQALYRQARVGLNFHRTSKGYRSGAYITQAESLNPRCYELAAMGTFFVSDPRAELADVLPMVPTFTTPAACEAVIRRALREPDWRRQVAVEAQAAIQSHTWTARAACILEILTQADAPAEVAA